MSCVHAGLSGSDALAEVFFGNLAVVACFMLFCPSQGDNVRALSSVPYRHPQPLRRAGCRTDLARLAIVFSYVLMGNRVKWSQIASHPAKSSPCFLMLSLRLTSSHVSMLYCSYTIMSAPEEI